MNTKINCLAFFLILILFASTYSTYAHASIPGIKMFLCANNPLGKMYDQEGVTPGQIMNNCKERLDGYSWGSRIYTLIYAPGFNEDPYSLETIGNDPENPVTARSKEGSMSLEGDGCNGFIETGRDHGLFYGSIKLSGFRYDITGDGRPDNFGGNRCERTYGTLDDGSGRVEAKQEGGVTISFRYGEDDIISKTAKYSWREATVSFDQEEYLPGETAVLTIKDLDNVRFPFDSKFGIPVRIYSDTDAAGIDLLAYWVADYRGIVQMNGNYPVKIELIDEDVSKDASNAFNHSRGELRTSIGDTIYAEYYDYTLPKPAMVGDSKKIVTIAKVVETKSKLFSENLLVDEPESEERKIEFKKYTSDGKYLFTVWWDDHVLTTGDNTFNISIVDGLTQKDVYNLPYNIEVSEEDNSVLQQKNIYDGKESLELSLHNAGITHITLSEIGTSSDSLRFQFPVKHSSNNVLQSVISSVSHDGVISDKVKNDLIMWVKHSDDEIFRNCLHDMMQNHMIDYKTSQQNTDQIVPTWLKMTTNLWLDDSISDAEFLSGLEYLVTKGII